MKKALITLAVAGAMSASVTAQADATLYGVTETRLQFVDGQDANLYVDKAQLGVKGADALENWDGVEARFQIEWRFDANGSDDDAAFQGNAVNDVQLRKANVSLEGDFGIVELGRQDNLGAAIKKADIFISSKHNAKSPDRVGNAAYYVTPRMSGFEGYAGLVIDAAGSDKESDVDAWQLGFNYSLSALDLSVAYTEVDGNYDNGAIDHSGGDDIELWGVGATYSIADLQLYGTYEHQEQAGAEDEMFFLSAAYTIGNTQLKAGYNKNYVAGGGNNDFDTYAFQVAHALGKKASVKAEYSVKDLDNSSQDDVDYITLSYALAF
ncbi:hypothetical protein GCM10011348_28740 [Marinobacterium nitratireducens]|uniref:Porin domain-containing protein n=1 Tax=Marinobacterium nitratireducens TaxID=518897 RepID=A0A917ZJJ9_9GAMM|nr:porin [Marinobacterium nitratireducens]GGO83853.1 hypothetical protein GCM10011348_28740 [Marinobacterium nitratireducens]